MSGSDLDPADDLHGEDRHEPAPSEAPAEDAKPAILGWCVAFLILGGVFYAALGVAMGPLFGGTTWLLSLDGKGNPADVHVAGFVEFVFLVVCGAFATLSFVGAWGLHKRTKYGWVLAMAMAVIYTVIICLPFGLVLLLGILKADVRKACGF